VSITWEEGGGHMKARKGFIGTLFAVTIALVLMIISGHVISIAMQSTRQEAWVTSDTQRSLYPAAWSVTNFVLQSLKPVFDAYEANSAYPFNDDVSIVFFNGNPANLSDPISITFDIPGIASCTVTLFGDTRTGIRVSSTVSNERDGISKSRTVKGLLYPHVTGGARVWEIVWR